MHPGVRASRHQILAEARLDPGASTRLHRHHRSEEIYHVIAGSGIVAFGAERLEIAAGDTLCIPPGMPHNVENTGDAILVIVCACAPPHAHDDTELLED